MIDDLDELMNNLAISGNDHGKVKDDIVMAENRPNDLAK